MLIIRSHSFGAIDRTDVAMFVVVIADGLADDAEDLLIPEVAGLQLVHHLS